MSTTTTTQTRNGFDPGQLVDLVERVNARPEKGRFQARTTTRWVDGAHSRTAMDRYAMVDGERRHDRTHTCDVDLPLPLLGSDAGPTPSELVLHALAGCIIASTSTIATGLGIELDQVTCHLEGDADLRGFMGLSEDDRSGFEAVRANVEVSGNGSDEQLRAVVELARTRSPVLDVVTNGVPVTIAVAATQTTQEAEG